MSEVWKDVVGYEWLYKVSNFGNIKRLRITDAYLYAGKIHVRRLKKELMLKQSNHRGYRVVGITKNGIKKSKRVHILVAMAFIKNPKNKPEVNHKDGIRHHNYPKNLTWATRLENARHASTILKSGCGDKNGNAKLNNDDVKEIRRSKIPQIKLARKFNVTPRTINEIKKYRTWQHLT